MWLWDSVVMCGSRKPRRGLGSKQRGEKVERPAMWSQRGGLRKETEVSRLDAAEGVRGMAAHKPPLG